MREREKGTERRERRNKREKEDFDGQRKDRDIERVRRREKRTEIIVEQVDVKKLLDRETVRLTDRQ